MSSKGKGKQSITADSGKGRASGSGKGKGKAIASSSTDPGTERSRAPIVEEPPVHVRHAKDTLLDTAHPTPHGEVGRINRDVYSTVNMDEQSFRSSTISDTGARLRMINWDIFKAMKTAHERYEKLHEILEDLKVESQELHRDLKQNAEEREHVIHKRVILERIKEHHTTVNFWDKELKRFREQDEK